MAPFPNMYLIDQLPAIFNDFFVNKVKLIRTSYMPWINALMCGHVVVVDPTPPTCCQQSPAPESCGSQQSLPPGGKERLHFVGIRPEVQARKGGW